MSSYRRITIDGVTIAESRKIDINDDDDDDYLADDADSSDGFGNVSGRYDNDTGVQA